MKKTLQQNDDQRDDSLLYLDALEELCGLSAKLIDTLVDMIYLAAADEDFLSPMTCEWLDVLQEDAQVFAEVWEAGC